MINFTLQLKAKIKKVHFTSLAGSVHDNQAELGFIILFSDNVLNINKGQRKKK